MLGIESSREYNSRRALVNRHEHCPIHVLGARECLGMSIRFIEKICSEEVKQTGYLEV